VIPTVLANAVVITRPYPSTTSWSPSPKEEEL